VPGTSSGQQPQEGHFGYLLRWLPRSQKRVTLCACSLSTKRAVEVRREVVPHAVVKRGFLYFCSVQTSDMSAEEKTVVDAVVAEYGVSYLWSKCIIAGPNSSLTPGE
jgi:hypothetical protein